MEATEEAVALAERFGPGAVLVFDGPADRCPICAGTIEQLSVVLDLGGLEPACCPGCGAMLAA